jgi:uncharacterized protein (TIGR01777 family)
MNITLTGGTGFIGRHLVPALIERGDRVTILSRSPKPGDNPRYLAWDAKSDPPRDALDADAVINLAGETVAQRWTAEIKQRIQSSRVESTQALVRALAVSARRPSVLISASAIGIYGDRGDEELTENSPPGSGFLEQVTIDWEHEAQRATEYGVRVVNPRIGIVLGRDGGALEKMLTPFKAGLGGKLGSGQQWMSWIHVQDLVGLVLFALDRVDVRGPVNATAPNPVRNAQFTEELGHVLHRPTVAAVPHFALKMLFGEAAEVIVGSQRVLPQAALAAGYTFRFPQLRPALDQLMRASADYQ